MEEIKPTHWLKLETIYGLGGESWVEREYSDYFPQCDDLVIGLYEQSDVEVLNAEIAALRQQLWETEKQRDTARTQWDRLQVMWATQQNLLADAQKDAARYHQVLKMVGCSFRIGGTYFNDDLQYEVKHEWWEGTADMFFTPFIDAAIATEVDHDPAR